MSRALAVLDYGAGNLASLEGALARLEVPFARVTEASAVPADVPLVLPGVGHFSAAKRALEARGLWELLQREAPVRGVLGVCLGLQLLCEGSEEAPGEAGLGLLSGVATRFREPLKVPHMGWNEIAQVKAHPAFPPEPSWAYFVHSYALPLSADTVDKCVYGAPFTAVAARGRVLGMQHHPEKSSSAGLAALGRAARWLLEGTDHV